MKRRLTVSILLVVAAALVLAGAGTVVLARFGARQATEDDLRGQVGATADLIALGQQRVGQLSASDAQVIRVALCRNTRDRLSPEVEQLRAVVCVAPRATPCTPTQRSICTVLRNRAIKAGDLEKTLQRESIALVEIGKDNSVVQGALPDGLDASGLDADRLRNSETVVGPVGTGFFGATAIDPAADPLNVIVISRPVDPVRGLVPWFVLASGVTLFIGVIVASSLSRKLTKPLRDATAVTAHIAGGDLSVRLPEHSDTTSKPKDELDDLARSINAMAEALERSRGLERQFLLSVSHDLRTPLTSIRGYAEAIADGAAADPTSAAEIILAESRRLERLVKDLLDLAKLDARHFALTIDELDCNEIAEDSVAGFRHEVEAAGLALDLERAVSAVPAMADADRLRQVIANLVENALKYAASTITVRVTSNGGTPCVEVEDDGPGIAPEDLPHVFERLYVATAKPRRKEAGSGLGLAIVRELVEAMGGHVDATSRLDGTPGTRMVVSIPPARQSGTTPRQ